MAKVDIQQVKQRFSIVGNSPGLNRAIDIAVQIAPTDISALITGESGVGKENFPQIIHQYSQRKHGQYIAVNCGAIPEGTIDSELFGHEKGSFTGALNERKGYFEVADKGTIFLDEVGELPLPTQARLLRVLETGEFIRVGSSKVQKTDVRIVAATNLNVQQAITDGKFREDLYYRLNTANIHIPPLRERPEDIILLFRKFAGDFAEKYRMPPLQLTEDARNLLVEYYWPGNIRQLKNITEQISVIETNREITADVLKLYLPEVPLEKLPAIFKGGKESSGQTFSNEREILYQVLFDMRQEINDLKKILHGIVQGNVTAPAKSAENFIPAPVNEGLPSLHINTPEKHEIEDVDICEAEESLSLEEVEKEMIKKALARHGGKRKNAAQDLKISERTLYRKIKEYGLE
ncbi:MAG: sigma-54 dependent transcriptional regulator [Candidatus Azobacteroides sp.]|nr:sigma-54 dependent transcriptional regulator [Candidatus Azobacteroides sp.]